MAARLNTPADFLLPNVSAASSQQAKENLLPPSVFETPLIKPVTTRFPEPPKDDPWQDLAKASSEILELKSQIMKLRETRHVSISAQEPIKAQVDVRQQQPNEVGISSHMKDVTTISLSHMDGIIQRQAVEIIELKQKVKDKELEQQRCEAETARDVVIRDTEMQKQLVALEGEINNLQQRHAQEIQRLHSDTERNVEGKNQRIDEIEENYRASREALRKENVELSSRLREAVERYQQIEEEFHQVKRKNKEEIRELRQQTSQLKTYVAESENNYKSSDTWRRELENLSTKLKLKDEEISSIKQNLDLSHVRQDALERILRLQEEQLSKIKEDPLDKKKNVLLTRWREKVYELMVQAKSVEISNRHQEHNWNLKFQSIEEKLEAAQTENQVKTAETEDKEAQLKILQHQIKCLNIELTRAQDVALTLDNTSGEQWDLVHQLTVSAKEIYAKYEETFRLQEHIESALKSYDQRIGFAAGRVFMLQSQFARKEALLKLRYEEPSRDKEEESQAQPSEVEALRDELSRVTEERDVLSRQLAEDSQLLEHKVNEAKEKVEAQIRELEDTIQRQVDHIDSKNQLIDRLRVELASRNDEIITQKAEYEQVREQHKDILKSIEKELYNKLEMEREQWREQLAEMEHKMNDARREQTKAVVSLRQLERSTTRNKEQMTERMSEMEKGCKETISKLEQRLRNTEKDRNLLMATLRQEGLIGQYKAKRPDPVLPEEGLLESTDAEEPMEESWKMTQNLVPESDTDPLHTVIDDLKTLTADVISDEEEMS